jgi:uncharacterized protein involved in exopolysaccharide biosynthesis
MEEVKVNSSEMSLATVLEVLKKRRWIILLVTLIAVVYGYASVKFGKKSYEAKAVILMNFSDRASAALSLQGLGSGGPTPIQILAGVLRSREAEKRIVAKTNITVKELRDFLVVNQDSTQNQISISMNFQPNEKALEVVKAAVEVLGELDREIGFSTASKTARNLEAEIKRRKSELIVAEKNLLEFQRKMRAGDGTVKELTPTDTDDSKVQTKNAPEVSSYRQRLFQAQYRLKLVNKQLETLRGLADKKSRLAESVPVNVPEVQEWKKQLAEAESQLRNARISLGEEAPEIVELRQRVAQLKTQVRLAIERYLKSVQGGVDPTVAILESEKVILEWEITELKPLAERAPGEALMARKLAEEVATLQQVIRTLRTKYEASKTEAEVDPVKWSILDEPSLDVLPSNFRPVRNAGIFGLTAFLGLCLYFIGSEALKAQRGKKN